MIIEEPGTESQPPLVAPNIAYQTFKQTGKLDLDNEWPGSRIKFTQADRERGFITKGLCAYSRHPNCASERQWSN